MKLIVIFGPHAVGKMTVGQELADGEISKSNYMKIDNSNIALDVVAQMVKSKFAI